MAGMAWHGMHIKLNKALFSYDCLLPAAVCLLTSPAYLLSLGLCYLAAASFGRQKAGAAAVNPNTL